MRNVLYRYLMLSIALVAFALPAAGQATPAAQTTDNFVTEKGFKNRIFDVRHREPGSLARVLRTLSSGAKGSEVSPNSEFRTITVRDFPENITVMEDALKRLDTQLSPRTNIDLNIHVMLASRTGDAAAGPVPSSLNDVLPQLRETFNYQSFEMVTSISQRLTETDRGLNNGGTALIRRGTAPAGTSTLMNYEYAIGGVSLGSAPTSNAQVQINEFKFTASVAGTQLGARMQTALNLRDGEKVVVGTAAFEDRALIVVLSAKLLK